MWLCVFACLLACLFVCVCLVVVEKMSYVISERINRCVRLVVYSCLSVCAERVFVGLFEMCSLVRLVGCSFVCSCVCLFVCGCVCVLVWLCVCLRVCVLV